MVIAALELHALVVPDLAPEAPALAPKHFAVLEAVHQLTRGIIGSWADELAVRDLVRHLAGPMALRGPGLPALIRVGLLERLTVQRAHKWRRLDGEPKPARFSYGFVRLTPEGLAEHYSLRPDFLALIEVAA